MNTVLEHRPTELIAETIERSARKKTPYALFRVLEKTPAQVVILLLSALATLICGYHPFAEDAGIYVACVKLALNPHLYPHDIAFVTAYQNFSVFSFLLADLVRLTHLPVDYVLLGINLASTWLLLYSCWQLARRCFQNQAAQWGAVTLTAVSLTLPIAGSSLFLVDPYLTSRSFSTPLTLLAICACLDRRPLLACLYVAGVALLHPLMAIYAAGFLLFLWLVQRPWPTQQRRWAAVGALSAVAILCGMILQFSQRNVTETSAYVSAVLTRSYFYLERWQWYEWIGLAAPLLLFFLFCRWQKFHFQRDTVALSGACLAEGLTSIAVVLLFCHPGSHSHLIARIQPIRAFHTIYFILFLMLGGLLGQYWLKRVAWRWVAIFGAVSALLFTIQLAIYPASRHLELPWIAPRNPWAQAFLWIRGNTPQNAIFAMDAHYIRVPGEDSHIFRVMAERSSLADQAKDGGTAAVFPQLAPTWMREQTAQTNLDSIPDSERIARLLPFKATWIVLPTTSRTSLVCPYKNSAVMVCRLV